MSWRRGIAFGDMAVGLLCVAFAVRAALMPAVSDTFWHLRAGADIWRTGRVSLVDTYSYTAAGLPWPDHEWLWQAFAFACHRLGGMPLATAGTAALLVVAIVVVHRLMVGPPAARFVLLAIGLSMSSILWVLRPQIVTLLAVPALALLLVRERYWPIPLLFLAWANAHAGVSLGGLVLGGATAAAFLRWRVRGEPEDRRRVVALAVVLPLSALAAMATPLGPGIFAFIWESTSRIHAIGIDEWQPVLPTAPLEISFYAAVLALVVLAIRRRRAFIARDGELASWGDWALAAGTLALLPLAFRSVRNIAPFLMLLTPLASRLLGPRGLPIPWLRRPRADSADHPRLNLALLAGAAVAAIVVVALAYRGEAKRLGWHALSDGAIAAIRSCDGPLYNAYNQGGYLIWSVPERPVFVDSRQDPYPLPFLLDFLAVERKQTSHHALFERWGIRCVFLANESPTVEALRRDGWVTRYRDDQWTVSARP